MAFVAANQAILAKILHQEAFALEQISGSRHDQAARFLTIECMYSRRPESIAKFAAARMVVSETVMWNVTGLMPRTDRPSIMKLPSSQNPLIEPGGSSLFVLEFLPTHS